MDRYVAIKVLPAILSLDPAFLKRFRREAQVVAKLEHKHILPVYDYGEQGGLTYLAMRYVEAGTLKDRLAAGQLDLPEIYRIMAQVGTALDYAHRLGVIHRDVKPSNVLIDSQGDAYLTDFGLARIMESSEQLTATGVGVGTPDYMAPEQGQGLKIDHRSDIYSLGVMLYEMVTGRVPYQAETPMAVVIKRISAPLPLPSSVKPDIPQQVERVILKAMAKDPDDRFQTVGEMVTALDAAVRLAQAEAPAEVAMGKLAAAKEAALPTKGFLARAMAGVREATQTGWGKTAMWAAVGVVALLAFFLTLSRVPLKVQIKDGQLEVVRVVEATITPEAALPVTTPTEAVAAETTATPKPTRASVPTATPGPTPTPTPPEVRLPPAPGMPPAESRQVKPCEQEGLGSSLCIFPYRGGAPTTILKDAGLYLDEGGHPSWSPDGQKIAFAAAIAPGENPDLYIVNADGSNLTRITFDRGFNHIPSWSPDSEWIAFMRGGDLAIVRPDGSDLTVIQRQVPGGPCFPEPHWSPDSWWIAVYADINGCPATFPVTREVWVISRDGQTVQVVTPPMIHEDASFRWGEFSFSPDGAQVIYTDEQGRNRIVRADGSAEPEFLTNWPDWWVHNFYPQWGGEEARAAATPAPQPTATPTLLPSMAEQARAFAEPILAAIADRPPDFEDDFGDPASGWNVGTLQNEWEDGERGYADGEYFIIASPADGAGGHTCISGTHARQLIFSDFVLDVDGRFISSGVGDWQVQFREWWTGELEGEGKYSAGINADGVAYIHRSESGEVFDLAQGLPVRRDFEANSLRIVAVGSQFALYVNGAPALYVNDPGYTERFKAGRTKLLVCHKGVTPLRVHFDNLKIWDISNLALP